MMDGKMIAMTTALPALTGFVLSVILTKQLIPVLHRLKFGQYEREEGMASHQKKAGTPTMGGIAFVIALVITCLVFMKGNPRMFPVLFLTVGFGLIGFLDDFLKIAKKENEGLKAWQKFILQISAEDCTGCGLCTQACPINAAKLAAETANAVARVFQKWVIQKSRETKEDGLRVLRQENLVKVRRDGKQSYYSLEDEHIQKIFEMGLEHILE